MPKQVDKYDNERLIILNKMFEILEITKDNNTFYLNDFDNNIEKQNNINTLVPDIKKYFICGRWNCFNGINVKRTPLSIIKNTLKAMDYTIISKRKQNIKDNISFKDTIYYIIKNNTI
jgi:hypothetical protein